MPALHMALKHRKAYCLRLLYVQALCSLSDGAEAGFRSSLDESSLESVGSVVDLRTKRAFRGKDGHSQLDSFIVQSLVDCRKASESLFSETGIDDARKLANAMADHGSGLICEKCCSGKICANSDEQDDLIISSEEGGRCVSDIKIALSKALEISLAAHVRYFGVAPTIQVELSTVAWEGIPSKLPGIPLSVNASTTFEDIGDQKKAMVIFSVAPLLIDRYTYSSYLYIMLHEVLCHAFQMVDRRGKRPMRSAVVDPISEGMMDKLVTEILAERAMALGDIDLSAPTRAQTEADKALAIHLVRRDVELPVRFEEAFEVRLGVFVLEQIRKIYSKDEDFRPNAEADLRRLAFALNSAGWEYAERLAGLSFLMCRIREGDVAIIAALLAYRVHFDVDQVINALTPTRVNLRKL